MHKTVAQWFRGGDLIEGEVGIEIELEGENLPQQIPKLPSHFKKYWDVTRDGSLRGEAYEYVLAGPVTRERVDEALTQMYRKLDGLTIHDSGRAGVHVHINVRELTLTQMFTFVLLYLVFEKVLVKFCGANREGNLFCLRVSDAEHLAMVLMSAIKNKRFDRLGNDDIRYASINLTALRKYGSLEFRAMRSPVGQDVISNWVKILLKLKDSALRFNDPEELMLGVSTEGGFDFARQNLGEHLDLLGDINWNQEVLEGLRMIQPLVKVLSEKHKEPVKEEPAPKMAPDIDAVVERVRELEVLRGARAIDMAFAGWVPAPPPPPAVEGRQERWTRVSNLVKSLPRYRAGSIQLMRG